MTNKRYTSIPKRQRCVDKEEPYIGGAEDIFDDAIQLKQSEINKIVEENLVSVSLSASAGVPVTTGGQGSVTLRATSKIEMKSIAISKEGEETPLKTETDKDNCVYTDNTVANYGKTNYSARFIKGGIDKTANITVGAIYFGYGAGAFDNNKKFVVKSGISGTYEIVIPSGLGSDPHVWFMVPKPWTISKSTKSGFDYPLKNPVTVIQDGKEYNAYESINTYGDGTEKVTLS